MPACPECEAAVTVPPSPVAGEILPCPDCGAELEILSLEPVTVGVAPAVEEDWGE